jgi:hypothetical protein
VDNNIEERKKNRKIEKQGFRRVGVTFKKGQKGQGTQGQVEGV